MAVAMMVDNPEGSQESYGKVRERLGLETPGGGILHVAGPSPNGGWRVIELFESDEDAQRFRQAPQAGLPGRRGPGPAATAVLARAQLHEVGGAVATGSGSSSLISTDPRGRNRRRRQRPP